ncbi:Calcineurin-like phosphoesterase [Chlamydia abortus]|uniref:Metallophosphoesterase family protein n=1 Tax=Paenibacillus residui TaxID=629724 RepID=A0ABW3DC63_9BACL|nr:Calcineurin-like phosphoesterase [Chlamydia abortus]
MTCFLYLTDTHFGANPIGFHQQPAYPERLADLIDALRGEVIRHSADFVIHGGDLIDCCSVDLIRQAYDLLKLPVPVYLCLGNHDLDRPDAVELWLSHAPDLFIGGSPHYEVVCTSCVVHVMPNHWESGYEYYWKGAQMPCFTESQLHRLEQAIEAHPGKAHVLVTHSPVFGMSREQSGLDRVIHDAPETFRQSIVNLVRKHPGLKVVLSGHNHLNTLHLTEEAAFASASSLIETPFEYKLVEVSDTQVRMTTHRLDLSGLTGFSPDYNEARTYVQGREQDREFIVAIP